MASTGTTMFFGLIWALMGCSGGGEVPQSVPVATEPVAELPEVVAPIPAEHMAALVAQVPSLASLSPAQQRVVLEALDQEPAPCVPCEGSSLAACLAQAVPDCEVAVQLGQRAVALVEANYPGPAVRDGVAYPDSWLPAARSEGLPVERIEVVVWIDPQSSFVPMVLGQLEALAAPDVDLRVVPWATEGQGRATASACLAAGATGLDCLSAPPEVPSKSGEAPELAERDALAQRLGVRATPTWFVNGHRLRGAQSRSAIGRLVELERFDRGEIPPYVAKPAPDRRRGRPGESQTGSIP